MVLLIQVSIAEVITEDVYEKRLRVAEQLNRMDVGLLQGSAPVLSGIIGQAPNLAGH